MKRCWLGGEGSRILQRENLCQGPDARQSLAQARNGSEFHQVGVKKSVGKTGQGKWRGRPELDLQTLVKMLDLRL